MEKSVCPNCKIELTKDYIGEWSEKGMVFKLHHTCNVCSFGYKPDWKEE